MNFPNDYNKYQSDFLVFKVQKWAEKHYYDRVVLKLLAVFSYTGGVIGSYLTALFFLNRYTSFTIEVCIAKQIFEGKKKESR